MEVMVYPEKAEYINPELQNRRKMIRVQRYQNRKLSEGSLKTLDSSSSVDWVDCLHPTKEDLEELSRLTCINIEDIKECLDPNERPRITPYERYTVIAFKSPFSQGKETITITIGIILLKYGIVTLRTHEIKGLRQLDSLPSGQKIHMFEQGSGYILFRLIDFIMDDYFRVMEDIELKMDKVENKIFRNESDHVMNDIFKLKKTLIYFHKALTANREVISMIDKDTVREISSSNAKRFRTIYYDINELLDIEGTHKDILTTQIEIHLSQISNNLNTVMKKMTALASFILIPTLISGIYGMNFKYMPELEQPWGYYAILGTMVLSVVLLFWYFRRQRYL